MTEHPVHMSDTADITRFVFAGKSTFTFKSTFTLRSKKTGIRFTYRVTEKDEGAIYFVALLNGSDNENDYTYLGFYRGSNYEHGRKSRITSDAPSAKAFEFFARCLSKGELHPALEFYHEGRCGRCSRKLTTPESVLTGIGPECCRIMGIEQIKCDAA